LARAYELKSVADYGMDSEISISADDAKEACDTADRFIATVHGRLAR
jgi:hypothetical protein